MHRFKQPNENKFGTKPPSHRIKPETIEKSIENVLPMTMNKPQAIWDFLGITETEYYEKYHTQPVSENALEIQQNIVPENNLENTFVETNP